MLRGITLAILAGGIYAAAICLSSAAFAAAPELVEKGGKELIKKGVTISGTGASFEVIGTAMKKRIVKCTSYTGKGKVTGVKTLEVKTSETAGITYTGCLYEGNRCNTMGQNGGTIITSVLQGEIGFVNGGTEEVGLSLAPTGKASFASFICGCLVEQLSIGEKAGGGGGDSVIGRIIPIETKVKVGENFNVLYEQTGGKQSIKKLNGGAMDILETEGIAGNDVFAYKESGLETPAMEPMIIALEEEAKITNK
jgi:hypothetical protein